jgi:hypothetical protein
MGNFPSVSQHQYAWKTDGEISVFDFVLVFVVDDESFQSRVCLDFVEVDDEEDEMK